MKPALTLGIILAAALTGGCTKYLQIVPVQALTDQPGAPLKGVPYSLYFDQFAIVTTAKLTGCVPGADRALVDELFLITQPAHLQKQVSDKLSAEERDLIRADMVRERLKGVSRPVTK